MSRTISDSLVLTARNLRRYVRSPQLLFFSSVQPMMFLLLFNYVFGGSLGRAIAAPGGDYINYLLPGVLVQVVMFGGVQTGIGLADDMSRGIVDRFRSLPMSRLAVVAGRTVADAVRNLVVVGIMLLVGTSIGFRFQNGVPAALGMIAVIVFFGYAVSWIFAVIGMSVRDAETAQLASFLFIFPLIFASSAFVVVDTMPSWLQAFARLQPVTPVVDATRDLAVGTVSGGPSRHALLWTAVLLLVSVPLALVQYRRRNS